MYATTGTAAKFWGIWKEPRMARGEREFEKLAAVVNRPLSEEVIAKMASAFGVKPKALTGIII